jgi:hypothetical protein
LNDVRREETLSGHLTLRLSEQERHLHTNVQRHLARTTGRFLFVRLMPCRVWAAWRLGLPARSFSYRTEYPFEYLIVRLLLGPGHRVAVLLSAWRYLGATANTESCTERTPHTVRIDAGASVPTEPTTGRTIPLTLFTLTGR